MDNHHNTNNHKVSRSDGRSDVKRNTRQSPYDDTSATAMMDSAAESAPTRRQQQQQQQHRGADDDKFDRFEAWLRENGALFDHLELRTYDSDLPSSAGDASTAHPRSREGTSKTASINSRGSNSRSSSNHATAESTLTAAEEKKEPAVDEESEMRGVHCNRNLPSNTVCMCIPRRCLITVEMGQATPIGQAILHSDLDLDAPKHIFLMVYVLWDRTVNGSKSFFDPYYQILPQTLHNMPVFWTPSELALLQGSHVLQQIMDRREAIAKDYRNICRVCPQLSHICTLEQFQWARMCVCSRNFGLQMDGHRTSALVPHADMLNHYRPRETKWTFDEERQAFTITTLQPIAAGAQVLDSYGQKCNHRFLLNYGFAVEDNREMDGFCPNEVPLELTVPASDPSFWSKLDFWMRGEGPMAAGATGAASTSMSESSRVKEQASIASMMRVRVCVSYNENTRLLFSLLRALVCSSPELAAIAQPPYQSNLSDATSGGTGGGGVHHRGSGGGGGGGSLFGIPDVLRSYPSTTAPSPTPLVLTGSPCPPGATYHRSCRDIRHPISLSNEIAVNEMLSHVCHHQLAAYPTTLEEDVLALQLPPPGQSGGVGPYPKFSNARHAKIQVRGEKEVLRHFIVWAETAREVLRIIQQEIDTVRELYSRDYENAGGVEVVHGVSGASSNAVVAEDSEERESFDKFIQTMEDDEDVHHTILRYCADVLGSLRREELRNARRQMQQSSGRPRA